MKVIELAGLLDEVIDYAITNRQDAQASRLIALRMTIREGEDNDEVKVGTIARALALIANVYQGRL